MKSEEQIRERLDLLRKNLKECRITEAAFRRYLEDVIAILEWVLAD
jgi:hypothetical protein